MRRCGADRRYKWAIEEARRGELAGAADILAQALELAPQFATAWFALGAIRDSLGDRAGAIAAFSKASEADAEDYHGRSPEETKSPDSSTGLPL